LERPRLDANEAPQVYVLKVVDVSDAKQPLVELTVLAKANAMKQGLLDRVNALIGKTDELGVVRLARKGTTALMEGCSHSEKRLLS
jgi:hypothetical protein